MAVRRWRLLFVCVENNNRSQMAEAFARLRGGDHVEAWSAGSRPSGPVHPEAVAAMRELDYDLTRHVSKVLDELPPERFRAVRDEIDRHVQDLPARLEHEAER